MSAASLKPKDHVSLGSAQNGWSNVTTSDGDVITRQTFIDRHDRDQKVRAIAIATLLVFIGGCVLAAVICGTKAHALQPQIDTLNNQIPWGPRAPLANWSPATMDLYNQFCELRAQQVVFGFAIAGTGIASGCLVGGIAALAIKMYKMKNCSLEKDKRPLSVMTSFLTTSTTYPLHTIIAKNSWKAFQERYLSDDKKKLELTENERVFLNSQR